MTTNCDKHKCPICGETYSHAIEDGEFCHDLRKVLRVCSGCTSHLNATSSNQFSLKLD